MTVREILQFTEVGKEYTSRQIKTILKANNIFVDSSVGNAMGKLVYQKYFTTRLEDPTRQRSSANSTIYKRI